MLVTFAEPVAQASKDHAEGIDQNDGKIPDCMVFHLFFSHFTHAHICSHRLTHEAHDHMCASCQCHSMHNTTWFILITFVLALLPELDSVLIHACLSFWNAQSGFFQLLVLSCPVHFDSRSHLFLSCLDAD